MSISAVVVVYNEEKRLETLLRCVTWCDEIIVMDKHSTDRTRDIALQYTKLVFEIPYSEYTLSELEKCVDYVNSEWVLWLTASDLIHPSLASQICILTDRNDFNYDVIHVPYRRYVLGLETKRSPWYSELHPVVFRKSMVKIDHSSLHAPFIMDITRQYKMQKSTKFCMYHLTLETVDIMMEHHLRYFQAEKIVFPQEHSLLKGIKPILSSIYRVIFKRKSFLMGLDGIALSMAFISYWMLRFVYIWEKRRSKAPQTYQRIKQEIMQEWKDNSNTKGSW